MKGDVVRLIGRWLAGGLCLLFMAATVQAQGFKVELAGRTVSVPAPPDHVQVSEMDPEMFGLLDVTTPQGKRLIEVLATAADLTRMRAGEVAEGHMFYVYDDLKWAGREPTHQEWRAEREKFLRMTRNVDASKVAGAMQDSLNESVERNLEVPVRIDIAAIGQPMLYRSDDSSIRLFARMSTSARGDGHAVSADLLIFAATVRLNGRVVFFNGACACAQDAARSEALHVAFDAWIDRVIAENRP